MSKKILLLAAVISAVYTLAEGSEKIVVTKTKTGDKTETHIPEVDYDKEKNKLDVSFRSDGNYDVIIDDEDGETRCRFGLNTSGAKQQYALPNLQEGVYTVTISSGINEFSGELYVDDETFYKPKTNYYEKNIIPVIPFLPFRNVVNICARNRHQRRCRFQRRRISSKSRFRVPIYGISGR